MDFRYGQILGVARVTLGDDSIIDCARVHIFGRPKADAIHEMPVFCARASPVSWILLEDIGKPVIVEHVEGDPDSRNSVGADLVALGGTRTWEIRPILPEEESVFTATGYRGNCHEKACDDGSGDDSESDSDSDLHVPEDSGSESDWSDC